jgi:hypothetical protein
MGMEMFLIATLTAFVAILIIDTKQKRHDFLCQQEEATKLD